MLIEKSPAVLGDTVLAKSTGFTITHSGVPDR
jgi:hypothetical protein